MEDKVLIIKSLKENIDEDKFIACVKKIADVASYSFKEKKKNDSIKNSIDAKLCHVGFKTKDDSEKFLYGYLESKELKDFFVKENPHGQVTIHLPKKERVKIKR